MLSVKLFFGSFLLIPDKLSTRLDSNACINLLLSIHFNQYVISLELPSFFSIGAEKVFHHIFS